MSVNKTNVKDIERNFAKFDLALICEEKYKALKHIDMVVYTMLKNQESLSIASVKNGNMKYVDKNGFIFISISQDKLCKILRTTKPTLKASLDRLAKCELVESVNIGTMKCNRIYVGNAESNITLGEYVKKIGAELDEEQEEKTPSINVVNVSDENKKVAPAPTETTNKNTDNKNFDTSNISQNKEKYNPNLEKNNNSNYKKTKFHNCCSESFNNYTDEEIIKMAKEKQKDKFKESNNELSLYDIAYRNLVKEHGKEEVERWADFVLENGISREIRKLKNNQ